MLPLVQGLFSYSHYYHLMMAMIETRLPFAMDVCCLLHSDRFLELPNGKFRYQVSSLVCYNCGEDQSIWNDRSLRDFTVWYFGEELCVTLRSSHGLSYVCATTSYDVC